MLRSIKIVHYASFFLILVSSTSLYSQTGIDTLSFWLNGTFTNQEQAEYEAGFIEFRLEIRQIWPDVTGEYWFYIEQIRGGVEYKAESKRGQRIYRLIAEKDGSIRAEEYEIPQPELYIEEWRRTNPFGSLLPNDLFYTENCDLIFYRKGDKYIGKSSNKQCNNGPSRVSYTTADVVISDGGISTWDRGYDSNDIQIWGCQKRPV